MHIDQYVVHQDEDIHFDRPVQSGESQLVLIFGSTAQLQKSGRFEAVRAAFPSALIAGCSTAGEIHDTVVSDDTLVISVLTFQRTRLKLAKAHIGDPKGSYEAGLGLASSLKLDDLVHVLVLSDGLKVNGTELVRGIKEVLPPEVEVTGGLAADGENFQHTLVCANEAPAEGIIAAIGFYGARLKVGYGSMGGWDSFGPDRLITRSSGNVLYDLDGKPALELYKQYLGDQANDLPASALLFPLMLRDKNGGGVVRTILSIDESEQSMTFAGDMPEGSYARLMRANFERLIDGAITAANNCAQSLTDPAQFALLISCVGRKLVLKQRIEEEVEGVHDTLRGEPALAGFYSYGEISPYIKGAKCELHNQTMTITSFSES